ncbi:hypothetical protein Lalb_Chr05g0226931 [Lupinus albus]|uniref:Uncharacterized protein n=1 Tax=Lupinus albus TaxID=3870 RepID=A0A6A4QIT6_LUPAL|nr:hypothetical protein Lalb_Chr05g0226931 [Lupinus albus]
MVAPNVHIILSCGAHWRRGWVWQHRFSGGDFLRRLGEKSILFVGGSLSLNNGN